jgi:hypothetical protein
MDIAQILRGSKRIAIIELSSDPEKDSYKTASYLKANGYKIVPVNPIAYDILEEKCYDSLEKVPGEIDIVDIFRPSEEAPAITEQAIRKKAKVVWMELGVRSEMAAEKAKDAGLETVMDKNIMIEHKRFQELALIEKTKTFIVPILTEKENDPPFLEKLKDCKRVVLIFVIDKTLSNYVPGGFITSRINLAQEVMDDIKKSLPQNILVKDMVEWGDWYDKIENLARLEGADEVVMKKSSRSEEFSLKLAEKGLKVTVL